MTIGWYNGWSPEERLATLPIQREAVKSGQLQRPTHCSICGCASNRDWRADDAVWFHDERYDRPLEPYPVCRRCHRILHQRFEDPQCWLDLVQRHGRGGSWFEALSIDPMSRFEPFAKTYPDNLPQSANPVEDHS